MSNFLPKISIQENDFDVNKENEELIKTNVGAMVNFIGTVRGNLTSTEKIYSLTLEHYPGMTENEILMITEKARKKWSLEAITVIHRVGKLFPMDKIVYVGVSSKHRQNSFDACNYIIDWLKTSAPFWKSEELKDGNNWIKARTTDDIALKKWEN
tara:strand:- start:348 stop:812 length:465 start_codon:yes stop_codon:yes gene_type:complete